MRKLKPRKTCAFPICDRPVSERHHIVYSPKPFCVGLCHEHHWQITVCNINEAERTRRKLSNGQRWMVYRSWLGGDRVPVLTENATKWMASWGTPPQVEPNCGMPGDVRLQSSSTSTSSSSGSR